jgi:hypothetical protein
MKEDEKKKKKSKKKREKNPLHAPQFPGSPLFHLLLVRCITREAPSQSLPPGFRFSCSKKKTKKKPTKQRTKKKSSWARAGRDAQL